MTWPFLPKLPPDKQWHVFVSYTTREDEVKAIKPFVDEYIRRLKEEGVKVCPVWYDGWYLANRNYGREEIRKELRIAIEASVTTSAFLSPQYCVSEWCNFEWDESERVSTAILPILWKDVFWLDVAEKFRVRQRLDIRGDIAYVKEVVVDANRFAVARCVEATLDLLRGLHRAP